MDYPTLSEVEKADREQIYLWCMWLPLPRLVRMGKGRSAKYVYVPEGKQGIIDRIFARWQEYGGYDKEISKKIWDKQKGVVE